MKLLKYPLIIISLIAIISVIFWDDLKVLFIKTKNKMNVTFHTNINNPFNIKANKANKWNGKTTKEGATFESFDKLENGVRAGIKIIQTYFSKYKLNTVEGIINRFAPTNENDTAAYINFVAQHLEVEKNTPLTPDKETLFKLSEAMCAMENGYELTRENYEAAWKLV